MNNRAKAGVVLCVAIGLALTGCGGGETDAGSNTGSGGGTKELTVTAGLQGLPYLQLLVAGEKDLYAKHGLAVEEIPVAGTTAIATVQSGKADLTVTLPENVIAANAQGADLVIVGATVNQDLYTVYATKDIASLNDLAGKKVGVFAPGNGTDIQMRWVLDHHGAGADKSTFVSSGGLSQRLAALSSNQVAATILFPPFDVEAENAGFTLLATMRDYISDYPNEVIAVKRSTLESKADVIRDYLAALAEAGEYIAHNPDDAVALDVKVAGDKPEVASKAFESMKTAYAEGLTVSPEGLQETIDMMKSYVTGLDNLPDVNSLYDPSYLPSGGK